MAALVCAGLSVSTLAAAADVPISEEARVHFAAGVALLRDPKAPRYEEAYREFKAAYAASPSYKILGNLGLCAMKIERDGEAIQAYELYLKEAGFELAPEERAQIERDLLTLQTGNARVVVSSNPPGATIFDVRIPVQGDEIRNSYGEVLTPLSLSLRHGHHVMKAHLQGYQDEEWEFEATGETMPPHVFEMKPPPPLAATGYTGQTWQTWQGEQAARDRPLPASAYVAGGITLALAAGGAVVGGLALKKHSDFNSLNDGDHVSAATSARSDGEHLNVAADVLFGAAIVGAVVTTYFVLTRPSIPRPAAAWRLEVHPTGRDSLTGAAATATLDF